MADQGAMILVVEDDRDTREAISQILEDEGFTVAQASNGWEALEYLAHQQAPRLILLDLMMPVMDGVQFRTLQLQNPRFAVIPVIAVTAFDAPYPAVLCNVPVIRKPVDLPRLLTTIRST